MRDQIQAKAADMQAWRRHIHANPEIGFEVGKTAEFVAGMLASFGCDEVVSGIGRTGVVGIVNGRRGQGLTVGLRAELDALPIEEASGMSWASRKAGMMHACGHDGHMAMLLGAGAVLAKTRDFAGRVALIFQPAEEKGGGARVMVADGLLERFDISHVFGMHNLPGLEPGGFAMRKGPIMAASDVFDIVIEGRGGHAALPHLATDPVAIAGQIISNLQMIVSRQTDPVDALVVSVTRMSAGEAYNVIPGEARLGGTVRSLRPEFRAFAEERIGEISAAVAGAHGAKVRFTYRHGYPVTVNEDASTDFAASIAEAVVGASRVDRNAPPLLGGEDFAYMLASRPGAFIFIGNGASEPLHHPAYDFNDDILVDGAEYWVRLVSGKDALTH